MNDDLIQPGEIAYHLDLTAAQLKIVHTGLKSLYDDLGHEEGDVKQVVASVLDKLPGEHEIRAINLDRELRGERGAWGQRRRLVADRRRPVRSRGRAPPISAENASEQDFLEAQRELGVLAHPLWRPGRRERHRGLDVLDTLKLAHELLNLF